MAQTSRRSIAVIGAGVSGLVAARQLDGEHDVTVYEANDYPGGHTRTLTVEHEGRWLNVDIGFIVHNDRTYPHFVRLLDELGVATAPSSMGFSVRDDRANLEFMGGTLGGLFAQRRNLLRPAYWRMLADIRRFFADGKAALAAGDLDMPLREFLYARAYGRACIEQFIVPMAAAIWSTAPAQVLDFPAAFFLRFFENHGLLNLRDRPQWRVVQHGSKTYVERLVAQLRGAVRLADPVQRVERLGHQVIVTSASGGRRSYDYVVFACHSDQALRLLAAPSGAERRALGAIAYTDNEVVLHSDVALLPRRRRAWAAWNYHLDADSRGAATLTYNMNILQGLGSRTPLCVTLNDSGRIDPAKVLHRTSMAHPLYTEQAVTAQADIERLNGQQRSFFCGAYWGNGFHEDGVVSALRAARAVTATIDDEQLPLQRAN